MSVQASGVARAPLCTLLFATPFLAVNLLDGLSKPALAQSALLYWSYDVTKWVLLPAASLVAMHLWCSTSLRDFGLRGPDQRWSAGKLAALSVLFALLSLLYLAAQNLAVQYLPSLPSIDLEALMPQGTARLPVAVYLSLSAAFVEELFYRGILREIIAPQGSGLVQAALYVLISSVLFGLSHFESGAAELVATGLYGILAGVFALAVRNLWPLVIGHFAIDLVVLFAPLD